MRSEPAPTRATGNNTVWEEYTDIAFLVANCFILLITSFVGTAANLFVIWAVHHQKSLQTWNNALLVNLAVIDILRCAVDCPILLTIVTTVYQGGHMDELICNAQVASFSFSCCLQLLTLACISAERYQAIAQPFKTSQRRKRIIVLIPLTWTLAILVAVICLAFVRDSPVYVKCQGSQWETISSYDTFGVYILIPLWTSCFGVITGFYASIFMLVRAHSRKIFDNGSFPPQKQDITKNADEQKNEAATVGEDTVHSKSDQNHIQSEPVAKVDLVTQVELNTSKNDSVSALLNPAKEHQSDLNGSENNKQFKTPVNISEFGKEQTHPLVTQDEPNSSSKDTMAGLRSSLAVPQRISKTVNNKNAQEAQVQTHNASSRVEQPHPPMTTLRFSKTELLHNLDKQNQSNVTAQTDGAPSKTEQPKVKTKSLNGDALNTVSSSTEPKRQSKAKGKTDEAPSEMDPTGPHGSSTPQSDKPEDCSTLLIDLEQVKRSDGETESVAKVDQVSASPQTANQTLATETVEQQAQVDGAVCMMPSFANKERANKKKESKMAKRSGYIIITFLLFWLPLITTIMVNFLVYKNKPSGVSVTIYRV